MASWWVNSCLMIGYSSGKDGTILAARVAESPLCPAIKMLYSYSHNRCLTDQAYLFKMAGCWPCSFLRDYGPWVRLSPYKCKKRTCLISSHLTFPLVNNPYVHITDLSKKFARDYIHDRIVSSVSKSNIRTNVTATWSKFNTLFKYFLFVLTVLFLNQLPVQ